MAVAKSAIVCGAYRNREGMWRSRQQCFDLRRAICICISCQLFTAMSVAWWHRAVSRIPDGWQVIVLTAPGISCFVIVQASCNYPRSQARPTGSYADLSSAILNTVSPPLELALHANDWSLDNAIGVRFFLAQDGLFNQWAALLFSNTLFFSRLVLRHFRL